MDFFFFFFFGGGGGGGGGFFFFKVVLVNKWKGSRRLHWLMVGGGAGGENKVNPHKIHEDKILLFVAWIYVFCPNISSPCPQRGGLWRPGSRPRWSFSACHASL